MSIGDSDSDFDDVPLSNLAKSSQTSGKEDHSLVRSDKKKSKDASPNKAPVRKKDEKSSTADDKRKAIVVKKAKASSKVTTPKKKLSATKKSVSANEKKKVNEKNGAKKKKRKRKNDSSTEPVNVKQESGSTVSIITASAELYSKCEKGKLIQSLLCRWWYAYKWPDPMSLPKATPLDCDALDGFPGVYVHTSGPNLGQLVDYRNADTCPNFRNFVKKSSEELKGLLCDAIEKQRVALVTTEGEGTVTEKNLLELLKWAKRVNGEKADKEAEKILKALR